MAVGAPPAIEALGCIRGSVRLIVARWALAILAALPGVLVARGALNASAGRQPWFTEAPDPLPLPQLVKVFGEMGAGVAVLLAGVALAWLVHLMLTAAAVEVLDPRRAGGPVRLWRATFDNGTRFLWVYLRISVCAVVALVAWARILSWVGERLADRGEFGSWSAATLFWLFLGRVALLLAGAGAIGLCAWWSRVMVVGTRRHHVRRLPAMAFRVCRRWCFQGFVLPWVVGGASLLAGATVLFKWRQSPGTGGVWFAIWLALLLAQAYLWHWRLRTACLIWGSTGLNDVRSTPDQPWHIFRRIRQRLRRPPEPAPRPAAPETAGE